MRRNGLYQDDDDDMFSAGTDLIISLLAILLIVIAIGTKVYNNVVIQNTQVQQERDKAQQERDKAQQERDKAQQERDKAQQERDKAQQEKNEFLKTSFPPNVIIEGAGEYAFPSSKAELTTDLKRFINNKLVDKIEDNFNNYDINVIEVIGHTDGRPLDGGKYSNLDQTLEKIDSNGIIDVDKLRASSNADLGLMRALAVVTELQKIQKKGRLQKVDGFRAYSAAQLTLRNGAFASSSSKEDDPKRRRIEIRFTRFRANESYGN